MPEAAIDFDPRTGEIKGGSHRCHTLEAQLAGAERDISAWRIRHRNLEEKVSTDIQDHPLYEEVKQLFDYWRHACKHPRSRFTKDRFEAALPYYEKYGEEMCKRAIDGLAYDPWRTQRRNGSWKVFNDWQRHLFKDAGTFEERCNCAPIDREAA